MVSESKNLPSFRDEDSISVALRKSALQLISANAPSKPEAVQEAETDLLLPLALIAVWHVASFAAFVTEIMPTALYVAIFTVLSIRLFILYHDRMHSVRARTPWARLFDFYAIPCQPYQDLLIDVTPRHLRHHRAHARGSDPRRISPLDDPHIFFEAGPWFRCLALSLCYDELIFIYDRRMGAKYFTVDRMIHLAACGVFIPSVIYFFGLKAWLVPFFAAKLGQGLAFFFFSHVLHRPEFYRLTSLPNTASSFRKATVWLLTLVFGWRVALSTRHHLVHHLFPKVKTALLPALNDSLRAESSDGPEIGQSAKRAEDLRQSA